MCHALTQRQTQTKHTPNSTVYTQERVKVCQQRRCEIVSAVVGTVTVQAQPIAERTERLLVFGNGSYSISKTKKILLIAVLGDGCHTP